MVTVLAALALAARVQMYNSPLAVAGAGDRGHFQDVDMAST